MAEWTWDEQDVMRAEDTRLGGEYRLLEPGVYVATIDASRADAVQKPDSDTPYVTYVFNVMSRDKETGEEFTVPIFRNLFLRSRSGHNQVAQLYTAVFGRKPDPGSPFSTDMLHNQQVGVRVSVREYPRGSGQQRNDITEFIPVSEVRAGAAGANKAAIW